MTDAPRLTERAAERIERKARAAGSTIVTATDVAAALDASIEARVA